MTNFKTKRVKNKELLAEISQMKCYICDRKAPSDPHHVTTRGAGGGDTLDNVIPLCHEHHVEIHAKGTLTFFRTYDRAFQWLEKYGRDDIIDRL